MNNPINYIDKYGLKLTFGQNLAVSIISSTAASIATAMGSPISGAAVGALTGAIASFALGGDLKDAMNNAWSGGISGLFGGYFGKWVAAAGPKAWGTGFLFDMGMDFILLGADPLIRCE